MHDLIVIGAGPAGSSLATALVRLGWDVLLIERRHLPAHKVCGEFLSPESRASLGALGLRAAVEQLGPAPMTHAQLVAHKGTALRVALPDTAWGISRFALDLALLEAARASGVAVRTGVTASALTATPAGATVDLREGRQLTSCRARAVIAACGRHPPPGLRSPARKQQPSMIGAKCHYAGVAALPQVELYLFDGGYAGLAPIEDGRVNLCLLASQAAFVRAGKSVRGILDAATRAQPLLAERLAGGKPLPETERAVAPVDPGQPAAPWHTTARVGDAATMIAPLCGDGMAMALRAAELSVPLAHRMLSGKISFTEWQHQHMQTWHSEFDRRLRLGRMLQALLGTPLLADTCLALGRLMPWLSRRLVEGTRGSIESSWSWAKEESGEAGQRQ